MVCAISAAAQKPLVSSNEVAALIGGGDLSALQWKAHLDVLLTVAEPTIKLRNLAWEGDTVFAQKRDFGFPTIAENVKKAEATLLLIAFGRMESLKGPKNLPSFKAAYLEFLGKLPPAKKVLLTPLPFEKPNPPLPDLSKRNSDLPAYSAAIKIIGKEQNIPVLEIEKHLTAKLTHDGVNLTPEGEFQFARAIALELGFQEVVNRAGPVDVHARWTNPRFEEMRKVAVEKNTLWFNYFRPQNWAFLGGDRTTQLSSRDHIDHKIRWFPAEIEQFLPLIQSRERELQEAAGKAP